jgi:hypothetical protein
LLPTRRRFTRERRGRKKLAANAPKIANVRAGVCGPFVKANPVIDPLTSDLNLTPSSSGPGSLTDALPGVADDGQLEHGQFEPVPVVNVHVTSAATSALPEMSFRARGTAFMVAVYGLWKRQERWSA